MAYRRSLTTSARPVTRQGFAPSFSCTHHEDDHKNSQSDEKVKSFIQSRSYGNNTNTWLLGFGGTSFRDPKRSQFLHVPMTTSEFLLARNMSTTNIGEEKIECMANMTADKTMEVVSSQAAAVSEVAVAAADSWPPVSTLQYAIDGIHIYTGLNWWASMVITTLVIRTLLVPMEISVLKDQIEITNMKSGLKMCKLVMILRGFSPVDAAEVQEEMKELCKKEGVGQYTPLFKRLFIQGPVFVTFFLAIQNMVEKIPSLQTGGISWFIDLTSTPDTHNILPFLTAFSLWATLEHNRKYGNPAFITTKEVSWSLSALTVPLAALIFPNAILCCWITSNFFSLVYGRIIMEPSVKKLLKIPEVEPFVDIFEWIYLAGKATEQRWESQPIITNQHRYPRIDFTKCIRR